MRAGRRRHRADGAGGTDQHIHEGEFISKFPLITGACSPHAAVGTCVRCALAHRTLRPLHEVELTSCPGHEFVGTLAKVGSKVKDDTLKVGQRVVADVGVTCGSVAPWH